VRRLEKTLSALPGRSMFLMLGVLRVCVCNTSSVLQQLASVIYSLPDGAMLPLHAKQASMHEEAAGPTWKDLAQKRQRLQLPY